MTQIEPDHIAEQVYVASRAAFSDLIRANPKQSFYAFALFTDDSLQFLHAAANTEEALTSTVIRYRETVDPKYGCTSTRAGLRWSYGDWKFFPEVGAGHFEKINDVFRANFDSDQDQFDTGAEMLWVAVLQGFQRLEEEHFFGSGSERSKITLLVVGDLTSELVNHWVSALNPPDVADRFTNWNPNAPDDNSENA